MALLAVITNAHCFSEFNFYPGRLRAHVHEDRSAGLSSTQEITTSNINRLEENENEKMGGGGSEKKRTMKKSTSRNVTKGPTSGISNPWGL